ncbi:MAG: hypothetical protein BHW65_00685 [Verrucomicrobia bacterium CAG:312_58_20]|nr:MAG: hypothetical protein BHW65_00685 [Verrucomicrobia bacterium CAG:312_58_20]
MRVITVCGKPPIYFASNGIFRNLQRYLKLFYLTVKINSAPLPAQKPLSRPPSLSNAPPHHAQKKAAPSGGFLRNGKTASRIFLSLYLRAACAAASLATGTRGGEQLT